MDLGLYVVFSYLTRCATCSESPVGWASGLSDLGGQDAHPTIDLRVSKKELHIALFD